MKQGVPENACIFGVIQGEVARLAVTEGIYSKTFFCLSPQSPTATAPLATRGAFNKRCRYYHHFALFVLFAKRTVGDAGPYSSRFYSINGGLPFCVFLIPSVSFADSSPCNKGSLQFVLFLGLKRVTSMQNEAFSFGCGCTP